MSKNFNDFQRRIGYTFQNLDFLRSAMTHASVKKSGKAFERLEFLGDRVLGLIIADYLHVHYPQDNEGALAKRLANLVRRETCEYVANEINVRGIIRVANVADLEKSTICSDAVEALIGAIYLDGGLDAALQFVLEFWKTHLEHNAPPHKDAKSQLQEYLQSQNQPIPQYILKKRTGPDHAPRFEVSVTLTGGVEITGTGLSKRIAEQEAAKNCLDYLSKSASSL
jgi:ribonuclease-3